MARAQQWAVAVRLPGGSIRYLCPSGSRSAGQDDWSPRANQALAFSSQAEAQAVADGLERNGAAREYLALRL